MSREQYLQQMLESMSRPASNPRPQSTIEPVSPFEMSKINRQQFSRDPVIANMQKLGRGIKDLLVPQTPTDIALSGIAPAKLAKGLFKTDYLYTPTFKNKQAVEKNFTDKFQSGFKNPQQLYATAEKLNPGFQKEIADISSGLGLEKAPKFITKRGREFDVEVKALPSIADKQLRGKDISEITDPIRTRIYVNKPENADDVVSELRKKYDVLDEGEKLLKSSGFQARNVNVAYKSPTGETIIGEVQLISKPMAEASAKAHPFYTKQRSIRQAYFKKNPDATDIPESIIKKEEDLLDIQRKFFAEARKNMDKSFLEKVVTTK